MPPRDEARRGTAKHTRLCDSNVYEVRRETQVVIFEVPRDTTLISFVCFAFSRRSVKVRHHRARRDGLRI